MANTSASFPVMPGRTIILSQVRREDSPCEFVTTSLQGLESSHITPNGTEFYVFNAVDNAANALQALVQKGYTPRYAHYRLFIKFTPPIQATTPESLDNIRNSVEQIITTHNPSTHILSSRLHIPPKGTGIVRNGILVLDRLEDLQELVNKSYGNFSLYRYRLTNNKPKFQRTSAVA